MIPRVMTRAPAVLRLAATVGLFALPALTAPGQAAAQSFDCRAVHGPDEAAVCALPPLARLDEQLATLYRREAANLPADLRADYDAHQVFFLNARRRCGEDPRCIEQSYRNRIQELERLVAQSRRGDADNATAIDERSDDEAVQQARRTTPVETRSKTTVTAIEETPVPVAPAPVAKPTPKRREVKTTAAPVHEVRASRTETAGSSQWVNPPPAAGEAR